MVDFNNLYDYVTTTPGNTNRRVLENIFNTIIEEKTPKIYYEPELDLDDFISSLDHPEEIPPFSLIVVQDNDDETYMSLWTINPISEEQKTEDWSKGLSHIGFGLWNQSEDGELAFVSDSVVKKSEDNEELNN